ncbi:hypothetical protein ABZ471_40210 [Streptomyces sp. NPDC005728]|uniref:hypothetical protein n=1 Tax=Streptomyces sp. NPDC005728 TaxID=3157054 RepID=UPI0034025A4B
MVAQGAGTLCVFKVGRMGGSVIPDLFRIFCIAVPTVFFFFVALDYRNIGLRFYDLLDQLTSAAPSTMTPGRFRFVAGLVSAVGLGAVVVLSSRL